MDDWSDFEVQLIIADYFSMLNDELKGIPINKSRHRRALLEHIKRSAASIEFKHQNISAALIELGLPFIRGYKPLYNFQRTKIYQQIERYQKLNPEVHQTFENFVENVLDNDPNVKFDSWIVDAPELKSDKLAEPLISFRRPIKVNYLEKEQKNRILGLKGEELVIEYEKWHLLKLGKENLADSVEWISKDKGDGTGFDILSKNLNGTDKYIEVKTTKLSKETPFFFTSNELEFSIENTKNFHLYRIFDFNNDPKMFMAKGSYEAFCKIKPIAYKGHF